MLFCGFILCFSSSPVSAILFGFDNISNNAGNSDILADQLFVAVNDEGSSQVSFSFYNGTEPGVGQVNPFINSFINEIYWDDTGFLDSIQTVNFTNTGTTYKDTAVTPPNLPSGNTIGFNSDFEIEPITEGAGAQGIDAPGDIYGVLFNITSGKTFNDIIAAMSSSELRIGLHVKGIDGTIEEGASDSFVTTVNPVPEPTTMLLLGAGLIGLAGLGRRKIFK